MYASRLKSLVQLFLKWLWMVAFMLAPQLAVPAEICVDGARTFDWNKIKKIDSVHDISQDDIARIIPINMQPTDRQSRVASKILDHAFSNWMKDSSLQQNPLIQQAMHLQESLQTDVSLGKSEPGAVEHKFEFQVRAADSSALVRYTGLFDADLSFKVPDREWKLQIHQKLDPTTDLLICSLANNDETRDNITISWEF